jgi:hypothetical protein
VLQPAGPPAVVALTIADIVDNGDACFGAGDVLTVRFNLETNAPSLSDRAQIDAALAFSVPIGTAYNGTWVSGGKVAVITVTNPGTALCNPQIMSQLRVRNNGAVRDAALALPVSSAAAGPFPWSPAAVGSVGRAGQITRFAVTSPADPNTPVVRTLKVDLGFDRTVSRANSSVEGPVPTPNADLDVSSTAAVLALVAFEPAWTAQDGTIAIKGAWSAAGDVLSLQINVTGLAPGMLPSWPVAGTTRANVIAKSALGRRMAGAGSRSQPLVAHPGALTPAPRITSVVVSDPDNLDGYFSDGDTVTITFDTPTDKVPCFFFFCFLFFVFFLVVLLNCMILFCCSSKN